MPVQKRSGRKPPPKKRSAVLRRTIEISGRRTSVSLENAFWDALQDIAAARGKTRPGLIAQVSKREHTNLSSALRLFVVGYYRQRTQLKQRSPLSLPARR
jgi:predicted DNA-binding ribbon-helix-helix protein